MFGAISLAVLLPFLSYSFLFCFHLGVSSSRISHFPPSWMAHLITYFMLCGDLEEHGPCPESLLLQVSTVSVASPQNTRPGHQVTAARWTAACCLPTAHSTTACCHTSPHVLLVWTVGRDPGHLVPGLCVGTRYHQENFSPGSFIWGELLAVNTSNSGVEIFLQDYLLSFLPLESKSP